MTNLKATKRALGASILSIVLCISMLLGTTFAWFTDTVTSGNNTIIAGNLDISLEYWTGSEWKDVEGSTDLFDKDALWEPGYTDVVYLKLTNAGSLGLKYQLGINIVSETEGTGSEGTFKLSDYIYMGVVEAEADAYATREEALAAVFGTATPIKNGYAKPGTMDANSEDLYLAVVVYMPETVGNVANHTADSKIPEIQLGIKVIAAQLNADTENDAFGNDYDENALFPVDELETDENDESVLLVHNASELYYVAQQVNSGAENYANKTIKLTQDISLAGIAWTPIGTSRTNAFMGTFDGDNHTISDLTATAEYAAGLFGYTNTATIKNLTVNNANVTAIRDSENDAYAGAVVGYNFSSGGRTYLTNVTVTNSTITAKNAGAIGGSMGGVQMSNCKATDNTVTGTRVGAILGTNLMNFSSFSEITVENNTLNIGAIVDESAVYVGTLVGRSLEQTIDGNVITETKVTHVATAEDLLTLSATALTSNNGIAETAIIVIEDDIDLANADFSAIIAQRGDALTVIGNNHTISNANIVSGDNDNTTGQASMFYAYPNSTLTVSDLTIANATVMSDENASGYAAAVIGYCEGTAILNNVDVVNATVTGAKSSGMLVGHMSGTLTATDCDLSGTVTITNFNSEEGGHYAGKYIGTVAGATTLSNCTADVTLNGLIKDGNIGAIYGRVAGGKITVSGVAAEVNDAPSLTSALVIGADVLMTQNLAVTGAVTNTPDGSTTEAYGNSIGVVQYGGTFDGGNNTLSTANARYLILTHGGTIKNLIINTGERGIVTYEPTEDIIIDNVIIDGPGYALNTAEHAAVDLIVTNSTLNGWTSFAGLASASFTNCKFGENTTKYWLNMGYDQDYDRLIRPYVTTTFTGCEFEQGFYIDLSALGDGCTVTLTDCTVNGVELDATNYTQYITIEEYSADTVIFK